MRKTLAIIVVALVAGCDPESPPNLDEFLPKTWSQAQSNERGAGYNLVDSTHALQPFRKWVANVGPVVFGSPVLDDAGVIYTGNVDGELVATNPDGSQRWRVDLGPSIVATPAVNTVTGDIFAVVIYAHESIIGFQSQLVRVTSTGEVAAFSTRELQTTAAPRLWGNYVFLPSERSLYVFDQNSLQIVAERHANSCFNLVCSGGVPGWLETVWNVVACVATVTGAEYLGIANCIPGFTPGTGDVGVFQEPAVMIVDLPAIVGDETKPTVVVATDQCLQAYRFDAAAPPDARLYSLWGHALVEIDCDFDTRPVTSPALIAGDQVIIADRRGRVESFDVRTGMKFWETQLDSFIRSPPVGLLRQIYVATGTEFVTLESDGSMVSAVSIRGAATGAAMSNSYVYVATREGIHTFDLDPTEGFAFDGSIVQDTHFGATTPALGGDGTVYVTTADGFLHAYGSIGALSRQVIVPNAQWIDPVDGDQLSYAPGRELALSLSDGYGEAFKGRVAIESDVDGALCSMEAAGSSGACETAQRLSLGAHTLTAFATDESGGTIPAKITVEVINTPPTVTILAPAHGASFSDGAEVTLRASCDDPDEASARTSGQRDQDPVLVPVHRIKWSSSRDGELGSGTELRAVLSLGEHEISATATDELGATAAASIRVVIQEIIE